MKLIFTLLTLSLLVACAEKKEGTVTYEEMKNRIMDSLKQEHNGTQETVKKVEQENKAIKMKAERAAMLDRVVLDEKTAHKDASGFLSTNSRIAGISNTITNNSPYTITNVEVTFNYERYQTGEILSEYVAKIGNLEPGENRLINAPEGDGYSASAYISKYKVKELKMCFDNNNVVHKGNDDPHTCIE